MLKVQFLTTLDSPKIVRQIPIGEMNNGPIEIYHNLEVENPDYVIVFNNIRKRWKVNCNPERMILITGEPSTIIQYPNGYMDQFHTVVTTQTQLRHKNVIRTNTCLPWHVGVSREDDQVHSFSGYERDFEFFKNSSPTKTKLASVVMSSKQLTSGHRNRLNFVDHLKRRFGNQIDLFGIGFNTIPDKWDAIAPYKYHIVLENTREENYWTEKLADAFLAEAFPIYSGCPDIFNYFSNDSMKTIDIDNPIKACVDIEKAIADKLYENNRQEVLNAKNRVMFKYNLYYLIRELVTASAQSFPTGSGEIQTLFPIANFTKHVYKFQTPRSRIAVKVKRFLSWM